MQPGSGCIRMGVDSRTTNSPLGCGCVPACCPADRRPPPFRAPLAPAEDVRVHEEEERHYLAESVHTVVLQSSIPAQIRPRILYISNCRG